MLPGQHRLCPPFEGVEVGEVVGEVHPSGPVLHLVPLVACQCPSRSSACEAAQTSVETSSLGGVAVGAAVLSAFEASRRCSPVSVQDPSPGLYP